MKGKGVDEDAGLPLTIYHVLLFDESKYIWIYGFTRTLHEDTYLPVFVQMTKTFRMKS